MGKTSLTAQLAAQILDHIRSNELARGQHLPSQALADTFRVSRAPVNSAFKFLENMGVVRFEANRGYFLASDAKDLTELKLIVNEEGEEDDSYFEIAEDRLAGKLPRGFGYVAPWGMLVLFALLFSPRINAAFFDLVDTVGDFLGMPSFLADEGFHLFRFWS